MKFIVPFCLLFVVACENSPQSLSQEDQATLTGLNGALEQHTDARRGASNNPAMQKLLEDGFCQPLGTDIPPENYGTSWMHTFEYGKNNCPIFVRMTWEFNRRDRTWRYNQLFNVITKDYRDLNPVHGLTSSGSMTAKASGATTEITGRFVISEMIVAGVGRLSAEIRTQQSHGASGSAGVVQLSLRNPGSWTHVAEIRWSARAPSQYLVNGRKVPYKAFFEMFSAFELEQIVDRGLKMR